MAATPPSDGYRPQLFTRSPTQDSEALQLSACGLGARDAISARAAATSSSLVLACPFSPQPPLAPSCLRRRENELSDLAWMRDR